MANDRPGTRVIPIAESRGGGRRVRATRKGRSVDPQALAEVRALLGDDPRRADLLIEYLHRIQDRYGHISAAHLVALAAEMKLAHGRGLRSRHLLSPLRRGEGRRGARRRRSPCASATRCPARWPAPGTCSRACRRMLGTGVRVVPAPCVGRCDARRSRWSARIRSTHATAEAVRAAVARNSDRAADRRRYIDLRRVPRGGRLRDCSPMPRRRARASNRCIADDGELGPARPRRRRLSRRAQVAHRARRARAAADGGQHRRGRARHVQGPLLPRARSAPLPRRHADRRVGRRASTRSTSTCATSTPAAARS